MTARDNDKPKSPTRHRKVLENAMDAASAAMKDAGKAYAAAGLDRKARFSPAAGAMHEAGKLVEAAVMVTMAQVDKAMDRVPHGASDDQ